MGCTSVCVEGDSGVGEVKLIGLNLMKSFERMPEVLVKNGVNVDEPVLFVVEASLYNFHTQDAVKFIQSFPTNARNVVVGTAFQRVMLEWVRDPKNQQARGGRGSAAPIHSPQS